jgi:hypothetical protein
MMLDTKIIESFNSTLLKLTGYKRREFATELYDFLKVLHERWRFI